MKAFKTVQPFRINQKELPHGCTLLWKRDNSAATDSTIPPQGEVDATICLGILSQTLGNPGETIACGVPQLPGFAA
ncbi:hypothetical protein ACFPFP_03440 [Bradyrhizobium sp. GCM10023182]|uniref:Uncharacterized protein n=1 Tax=Bradyrhizobium zhengyangense TaxID=2911009 RepID=A0ABS9LG39_9BRAD|nr:hypothetical protein [Bradyrhizobium zhengyangense]MCG2665980.1 hypothetical protein [Bradyrhizobium zhengyangense]